MNGRLNTVRAVTDFILAGNATFTLVSKSTGTRFTYKAQQPEGENKEHVRFVRVLTGPNNEEHFQFLGTFFTAKWANNGTLYYKYSGKSKIGSDAPSAKAIAWFTRRLHEGDLEPALNTSLEVWHEGRCGRCGRKLTVPESIASGFGPECARVREGTINRSQMNLLEITALV